MNKHTPGPWHVYSSRGTIPRIITTRNGGSVADANAGFPCSQAEQDCNARLIAAAPDLLDLAHAVVTAFGNLVLPTHTEKHLLDGARAAISKAEGGAQ